MNQFDANAIVLGEQSLLIQCCEVLLKQGFALNAVVTSNPQIIEWCEDAGLQHFARFEDLKHGFSAGSQDYLFSITNLRLLPDDILSIAKNAINFHDGPLPKYAGLNAPVWAILNDEAGHGVTWHEITSEVDKGRILAQQTFPIVPGETALSINAKCYQAGLESFGKLVDSIVNGTLERVEQNTVERSYFGLTARPSAAGVIDWCAPVKDCERLIRALDHGGYRNPLVSPKFLMNGQVFIASQARIQARGEEQKPGELIAIESASLSVGCSDGVIELSGIKTLKGDLVQCLLQLTNAMNLSVGDRLQVLSEEARCQLDSRLSEVCRHENAWVKALLNSETLETPYTSNNFSADSTSEQPWQSHLVTLPANVLSLDAYNASPRAYVIALFSVLFARLNSKTSFTFASIQNVEKELAVFFEDYLPLPIDLDDSKGFEDVQSKVQQSLESIEVWGALASDIWAREPALASHADLASFPIKLDLRGDIDVERLSQDAKTELVLSISRDSGEANLIFNSTKVSVDAIEKISSLVGVIAAEVSANPSTPLANTPILSQHDLAAFEKWNASQEDYDGSLCLHQLIEQQAIRTPEAVALAFGDSTLNYQMLNARANRLANMLIASGVESGDLIGVMMDRSIELIVALIAIHKAGCAYVPLDPVYPADRLRYMVEDSSLSLLLTESSHKEKLGKLSAKVLVRQEYDATLSSFSEDNLDTTNSSDSLAYVIYTSGSTGKPKGVMVEHRNVVNFFVGMDRCIDGSHKDGQDVWLAVTSISFDISVLEIFWTLARGFKVVIYRDPNAPGENESNDTFSLSSNIDFSLFYWNVADEESHHQPNKYELLLEGAKFADANGFKAVWNPERHFASFGGLFPNPAVTGAALAAITDHVDIRAGSCVVPLHSPIRVAEEWAVVDNLSNGRVGIAVASGWAPPDFAIKPENFSDAKNIMFESLEQVRRLWRGETVTFPGPTGDVDVRTLPRPIQKELPYWVTTAGNVDTFKRAGEAGANVLTHLLGQTFEEVQEKVQAYRQGRQAAGHSGQGTITLMLHTLIGDNMTQVEEIVRQPMKDYLRSAMFLVKGAAWNFPTFKKMSEETGKSLDEFFETISDEDMDDLLEFAFQRYFRTSGLFGTPDSAVEIVARCEEIGVDEIACLIDFGIDTEVVMKQLPYLNALKEKCAEMTVVANPQPVQAAAEKSYTIPELIEKHQVTHFQCTPSMATMLVSDSESKNSLTAIKHMMVGGEALPSTLADTLIDSIGGRLTNMYGPTETTIWSSIYDVEKNKPVAIGHPIANTQIYIVDQHLNALPAGVPGELVIGGDGVVRGYHNRQELTGERFVDGWKLTPSSDEQRIYRTGDLASYSPDGTLLCLGRIDHQVKIRGYRIELGEIEALLQSHDTVRECAVILREDKEGDKRLVAYIRPRFEQHVNADDLKTYLSLELPDFMVPAFYVEMASMPLTPNGKLDRNALPEPIQQKHQNSAEYALPEDDWENLVATIWKKSLGVQEVGRKDNFFDIGGHSLLVIQVLKELREHDKVNKPLQMTDLFKHTTVEALAKYIASEPAENKANEGASSRVAARKAAMSRRRRR